jgi:D-alanyl-D-alanine carboxypeptidase (penicillin-binding protein 5/6)
MIHFFGILTVQNRTFATLFLWLGLALAAGLPAPAQAEVTPPPPVAARAWLLLDVGANQVIGSLNPDERVEPASLTKLMTAYVVFQALRDKKLALNQVVPVSEKAWRAGGSRMFIDPKRPVMVEELIQGMIIQSGNDACTALAEAVAGSEDLFAQMMNREAKRLGMANTSFMNASGLPDPKHMSTARDLAMLASALIRDFPEQYAKYYSTKEYRYNNITQHNRNRLLWLDPNVDGVKTGYTDAAGYCLIASARRGPRRMLSVVLGTASDAARAQESQKLLNFGFQFWDSARLYEKGKAVSELDVWKGAERKLKAGFVEDLTIAVPRGEANRIKVDLISQQPLVAPVAAGQRVGTLRVSLDDKPLGEFPVLALEPVAVAGIFGRTLDTVRLWFK